MKKIAFICALVAVAALFGSCNKKPKCLEMSTKIVKDGETILENKWYFWGTDDEADVQLGENFDEYITAAASAGYDMKGSQKSRSSVKKSEEECLTQGLL